MEATRRRTSDRWTISKQSFEGLLRELGSDAVESSLQYEALRSKLILYFSRRSLDFPEDLADEVLDRLARRLAEGVQVASWNAFALGIARHVAQERLHQTHPVEGVEERFFDNIPAVSPTQSEERRLVAMEECLRLIPAGDVELLESYFLQEGGSLIAARRHVAERLGITQTAVRQRVFLLRRRLRGCVEKRLGSE